MSPHGNGVHLNVNQSQFKSWLICNDLYEVKNKISINQRSSQVGRPNSGVAQQICSSGGKNYYY